MGDTPCLLLHSSFRLRKIDTAEKAIVTCHIKSSMQDWIETGRSLEPRYQFKVIRIDIRQLQRPSPIVFAIVAHNRTIA